MDTGRHRLLCGTKPIQLGPLTYRLLLALVEAAPDIATHDELINFVWGGRSVSPETINQRVKLLRDAIADDAQNPRYIELVRGHGYRLIPPVEAIPTGPAKRPWSKTFVRAGAGVFIMVAAAVIFWFVTEPPGSVQPEISVAVLPVVDMSAG